MSLMLRLLAITLLLSSLVKADSPTEVVEEFLTNNFENNPSIESVHVGVKHIVDIKNQGKWKAYFVDLEAVIKKDKRKVTQRMLWFSNGSLITKELYDIQSNANISDLVSLPFKDEYYSKSNLIYGDENAKHKVVIFSDPLCPFCKRLVPPALEYMKKYPKRFAVYYYHFPLPALHPAAVELVKAATALELTGRENVVLDLYKVKINPRESSVTKILDAFNKTMDSNIKPNDLNTLMVKKQLKHDLEIANEVMIKGTPTIFLDGKVDRTKTKYKEAK